MRLALYARVSTDAQEARGTVASQLELLRQAAQAAGDEVIAEFVDEGYSGARLDRPALDRLRDAAAAGLIEQVVCLCPDRLARSYAYQVLVLEELGRFDVSVRFLEGPQLSDDPQARLLVQVQGVIAEYERAKIAERYRRGKLHRARSGEVLFWRVPYGYRRSERRLEVFEAEAEVVRWIFRSYTTGGRSIRQICRDLAERGIPSPHGKPLWGHSTVGRLLRNEAYVGTVYYNRNETIEGAEPRRGAKHTKTRSRKRPREEWIAIGVPPIVDQASFEAAQRVSRDNSKWNPRGAEPGAWLLRGLVECGHCGVGTNCHKMRGRNGTSHRYCRNHDPLRAGGHERRCPERNIRADELDAFVFEQVRLALLDPHQLAAGEGAVLAGTLPTDDELLEAQLAGLERRIERTEGERARLVDAYQAAIIDLPELSRRSTALTQRHAELVAEQQALREQRAELARHNRLRQRLAGFAQRVTAALDELDFEDRQRLLRLVLEKVTVSGWRIEIHLKIPLPDDTPDHPRPREPLPAPRPSSDNGLRPVGVDHGGVVDEPVDQGCGDHGVAEDLAQLLEAAV